MLLLNISTDNIYIQINDEIINLDRHEIENIIWPTLIKLYKKYNFTKVLLINWPWWFTNLRVWTLAINLLNSLENWDIDIHSITKIDLFKHFVDQKLLPNKWIIYIWQKKNIWLYNFIKWEYDTITKPDIDYNSNIFLDLVYNKEYFDIQWDTKLDSKKINIYLENNQLILDYNKTKLATNIEKLKIKAEKTTDPKYFIKPIMGKQCQ
jgi:hypothetical protein